MCCSPLILLLITGALLIPTEGQDDYHGLSKTDKSIVDMAIKHGNKIPEKPQWHMNYFRFRWGRQEPNLLSTELWLRATDCKNTGMTTHQNGCKFTEPMRIINCLVCTDDLSSLEPFFIHCDWQRNVHKHAELRKNGCKKYDPGRSTLFALMEHVDPAPE